jgi:hypothetical protein
MLSLPSASTRLSDQGGTAPASTDLLAVWAPVVSNADAVPRLYSNVASMISTHDHGDHVDFASIHMQDADLPVLLVPVAISTAGSMRRQESVHTGTAKVTAAVGASGALKKVHGLLKVTSGGTVGTDQILLDLSLDGGESYQPVRLGTATSYAIPRVGVTVSFLSTGTLVDEDTILEFETVGPVMDATGITAGLAGLTAKQWQTRSWLFMGEVSSNTIAQAIAEAASAYETASDRFVDVQFQARDTRVLESSRQRAALVPHADGAGITFAEVGATGDTITRANGSFVTDGFQVGDWITVTGAVATAGANNISGKITGVTATVLTLDTADLINEGPITSVAITTEPSFIFATPGMTITRNRGSWTAEGFAVGDTITVDGTASNDGTHIITALSATVMTCEDSTFVAETIGSCTASVTLTESDTAWQASIDTTFALVDDMPRVNLVAGFGRKTVPVDGFYRRLPWAWADTVWSFLADVHIATWWKARGPVPGWSIEDEHDERVNEGLIARRFTCARTWSNGPPGAFTAMSITRATDGSILSYAHNMRVANVAQTVCQRATEDYVGQVLVLNPPDADGVRTATKRALTVLEAKVNAELQRNLLANLKGDGPRASSAKWTAATDDDLGVVGATLNGTLELNLNGTIFQIATIVEVR